MWLVWGVFCLQPACQELDGQTYDLDEDGGPGKGITLTHSNHITFSVE